MKENLFQDVLFNVDFVKIDYLLLSISYNIVLKSLYFTYSQIVGIFFVFPPIQYHNALR